VSENDKFKFMENERLILTSQIARKNVERKDGLTAKGMRHMQASFYRPGPLSINQRDFSRCWKRRKRCKVTRGLCG